MYSFVVGGEGRRLCVGLQWREVCVLGTGYDLIHSLSFLLNMTPCRRHDHTNKAY